jgi:transposase
LAPRTRQSGKRRWRESIGHGRPGVRRALFNAARSAIAHPSPFHDFYNRLVNKNRRPGKVALVAVMRKILVTANALARDRQPWHAAAHDQATAPPASPLDGQAFLLAMMTHPPSRHAP